MANDYKKSLHKLILFIYLFTLFKSLVHCEKIRHNPEDTYVSQLEEQLSRKPHIGCPNCTFRNRAIKPETADSLRIEAIKRQILSKLGLRHKPNITHSLPRELIMETIFRAEDSLYSSKQGSNDDDTSSTSDRSMETVDVDDFYGRTSEIISFAEKGSKLNQFSILEFRVSPETGHAGQEFQVRNAVLWLKADLKPRRHHCKSTEIYVFKIRSQLPENIRLSSNEFEQVTSDPVSLTLDESKTGWQKIDLTSIVTNWLTDHRNDKLRLFVDCSCCKHWNIHLFNNNGDTNVYDRPFLVIHTDPNTTKRVRRRAIDCSEDTGNQCCKQRFYVSFKDLGWDDWVIAPQGYYANYCRGDCGFHRTPDTFATYHTQVIEEVRKTHHLTGMQPCCAPLKFSSMSLIYYGPDFNIIKRDLPKMVVDECGCP